MNTQAVRNEMLKCHHDCSVGIMPDVGHVNLVWTAGNNIHTEKLKTVDCMVDKPVFKQAMGRARIGLITGQ